MLIFPDRENREFANKYLKDDFTQGIFCQLSENFEVSKIKSLTRFVVECGYNLSAF